MGLSPRKPGRDSLIRHHLTCPLQGVHSSERPKSANRRHSSASVRHSSSLGLCHGLCDGPEIFNKEVSERGDMSIRSFKVISPIAIGGLTTSTGSALS